MTADSYPYLVQSLDELPRELSSERRGLVSLDPSIPRVSIYCLEDSHEGSPWFVGSFVGRMGATGQQWVGSPYYPTRGGYGFAIDERVSRNLLADTPAGASDGAHLEPQFRIRYNLRCETCGLSKTRRSEVLNDDAQALWEQNIREISLKQFIYFVDRLRPRRA